MEDSGFATFGFQRFRRLVGLGSGVSTGASLENLVPLGRPPDLALARTRVDRVKTGKTRVRGQHETRRLQSRCSDGTVFCALSPSFRSRHETDAARHDEFHRRCLEQPWNYFMD